MERKQYITLRVTERIKRLYKSLSYEKSPLVKKFLTRHSSNLNEYIRVYSQIERVPPSLIGGKFSIFAPTGIRNKDEFKAFIGYLTVHLIEAKGNIEVASRRIREDLGIGSSL